MKIFFVQFFCVFLPPLLNIFCFLSVQTISVLYRTHLCIKCSLGISSFLEEISSLSRSIVFLYVFALITEEGFLISLLFSGTCIQMDISFLFSLFFASFLFTAICKAMRYSKSSSKREVYSNTILPQERRQQENYWIDKLIFHLKQLEIDEQNKKNPQS